MRPWVRAVNGTPHEVSCAGNESQAIVEFAPFQKVPAEKKKVDARNNTIDKGEKQGQTLDDTGPDPNRRRLPLVPRDAQEYSQDRISVVGSVECAASRLLNRIRFLIRLFLFLSFGLLR